MAERKTSAARVLRLGAAKAAMLGFAWLLGQMAAAAAPEISVPSQSGAPGSSILFAVALTMQESAVSGIQFDLQYDSSVMSLSPIIGDAARSSGKSFYYSDLSPTRRRFLITGLNQNPIAGGVLMTLFVNVTATASNGIYPLTLSDVTATDESGQRAPVNGASGAVVVQGTINQAMLLQIGGVLNGASLLPGPISPGQLLTLIGSGIGPVSVQGLDPSQSSTILAGTSVMFDGAASQLLYAAPNQINAVVPYELAGRGATQLQVMKNGQAIAELSVQVAPAVPAIFTRDSNGVGLGAILNENFSINSPSNPAIRGSAAVLFATGLGLTDPPGGNGPSGADQSLRPVLPASIEIGGVVSDIISVTPAPDITAGVLQIRFMLPQSTPSGYTVPIFLKIGEARSQIGVTIAVR